MAKLTKGILGGFTSKIGDVVGSSWKGIPVFRRAPSARWPGISKTQVRQQARFILISRFLRPLTELLNQTFKNSAAKMSCFNKAFSVNKDNVTGVYPSFRIHYSSVLVSSGTLPSTDKAKASSPKPGRLLVSWNKKITTKSRASGSDTVFLAAYSEELDKWFYNSSAARRIAGSCNLDLSEFSGREVQTYLGFIGENGKRVSNSLYLGRVKIL